MHADERVRYLRYLRHHHDYAKRRSDRQDADGGTAATRTPPVAPEAPAPKRGRQQRDPDGGIYISARSRARKAPLPMKLRALPASFWKQPNLNRGPSPGTIFSALPQLPPLCKDAKEESAAPPKGCSRGSQAADSKGDATHVSHSTADTELLFSLFHSVEPKTTARRRARGRPRRSAPATGLGAGLGASGSGQRDDDPCLLDSLTGGLLPASRQLDGLGALNGGASALQGGTPDNNLAQILSDLVVKL